MKQLFSFAAAVVLAFALVSSSFAAEFPVKPIKMIVPFSAGGGTDSVARVLASCAEKHLGKNITVLNKTGGGGAVGMTEGSVVKPDGYTITMITQDITYLHMLGQAKVTARDYNLICLINEDPAIIVVNADSPYKTLKDLVDEAKANPGKINLAAPATGSYAYALELSQNIIFNRVPYDVASETIPAVLGGHADFTMVTPGECMSQLESGQLRGLAVCSDLRNSKLPDVPTTAEAGYPFLTGTWRGIAVPKGTPDAVKGKLLDAFTKAVEEKEYNDVLNARNLGIRFMKSEEFRTFAENDEANMVKIVDAMKKWQKK